MVMYQEVADSALALHRQETPHSTPALERLINETFRMLLNFVYLAEMYMIYYVPIAGPPLYFLHSCWLASIYCFEYKWVHLRWASNDRLDFFERHWLYFAGFGFPVSIVSFLCPRFIDAGVFALLFPLCILTATAAEPRELRSAPRPLRRLRLFVVVHGVSCFVLRLFRGSLAAAATPTSPAPAPSSRGAAREGAAAAAVRGRR